MIRALLVDDEVNNLKNLSFLLQHDCEDVEVAGIATNAVEARQWLQANTADVIFLDIQMPKEDGFQFLSSLQPKSYKVIFVTAYDEYAIKAIKANALDYLLKPVRIEDLQAAVIKLKQALSTEPVQQNELMANLLNTINKKLPHKKIALPHLGGTSFIEVDDIISLQADSNYTVLHLNNMQKIVISKTLKDFEELLDSDQFCRIHKSYIVNLQYVKEYNTSDGGIVKMSDGNQWSISRRQLDLFLNKMRQSSLMFGK